MKNPSAARLRAIFIYEPETGNFIFRPRVLRPSMERYDRRWNTMFAGKVAGCAVDAATDYKYIRIWCDGRLLYAHRMAWAYIHDEWPNYIDHINGDRLDNRIANLRPCTQAQNLVNRRGLVRGVRQVKRAKGRVAWIAKAGRSTAGTFSTPEEARAALEKLVRKKYNGFYS